MKNFQAHHKTVRDLLGSNFYYLIPKFQRPYAWTKDNAQEMWEDLQSDSDLFFGSFVFNVENKEKGFIEIVDGQQRITTINILMSAVRNKMKEIGEEVEAHKIQEKISFTDDLSDESKPRLQANEYIKDIFENTIQSYEWSGNFPKKISKNIRQIKDVYEFFTEKLNDLIEENDVINNNIIILEIRNILKKLYESKIIWIEVSSDEDAYSIFETMNARGADLTAADLLKNYLFSKLSYKENFENIQDGWKNIENNVSNVPRLTISKYLRYYWLSKYDFITEKNLYRKIKQSTINPESLLEELNSSSEWFSLLGSGTEEEWGQKLENSKLNHKDIFSSLEAIRLFGTTQCYVLFLCLLRNIDKISINFSYIFKEIENFHFLYSAVSKQPGNKVEKLYSSTAKEINKLLEKECDLTKIANNVQSILSALKNKMEKPTYELFKERFNEISYKDGKIVSYIFDRLNRFNDHKLAANIKIFDNNEYNTEHILPKDPKKWGLEKKETEEYIDLLGNLIIVDRKVNGWMQNDVFADKIEKLKVSSLPIIKDFINEYKNVNWSKEDIINRQEKLAEVSFYKVWN